MQPNERPVRPYWKRDMWGRYIVWPDPRAIAFGQQLRRCRRQSGLSQQKVADRAAVSQSVISRLEHGKAPGVTVERLIRICDVMGWAMPLGFCPHSGPDTAVPGRAFFRWITSTHPWSHA